MNRQQQQKPPARWSPVKTAAAVIGMAAVVAGLLGAELRAQSRSAAVRREQGAVATSQRAAAPIDRPSREARSSDVDPKARAATLRSLGYTQVARSQLPPAYRPPPPAGHEPPDPTTTTPPFDNPGGVDGVRPPRPIPGLDGR
jgi:hypothetical protein